MSATVIRISDRLTLQQPPDELTQGRRSIQTLKLLARFEGVSATKLLSRLVQDEAHRVLGRRA